MKSCILHLSHHSRQLINPKTFGIQQNGGERQEAYGPTNLELSFMKHFQAILLLQNL